MSHFSLLCAWPCFFFFFFNDTATTEIYTLSLHDALPISQAVDKAVTKAQLVATMETLRELIEKMLSPKFEDRKSTRLNSSHGYISYAVFCLKKKKKRQITVRTVARTAPRFPSADAGRHSR